MSFDKSSKKELIMFARGPGLILVLILATWQSELLLSSFFS